MSQSYQELLQTYNLTVRQQQTRRNIQYRQEVDEILEELKKPSSFVLPPQEQQQKLQLPTPSVGVKQAWSNSVLDKFTDRFLISVNDFDENGDFYVQNEVTMKITRGEEQQSQKSSTSKSLKQQRLKQLLNKKTDQFYDGDDYQ